MKKQKTSIQRGRKLNIKIIYQHFILSLKFSLLLLVLVLSILLPPPPPQYQKYSYYFNPSPPAGIVPNYYKCRKQVFK